MNSNEKQVIQNVIASLQQLLDEPVDTPTPTPIDDTAPPAKPAWQIYLDRNPDVAATNFGKSAESARNHWDSFGKKEYLRGSPNRKPWPGEERDDVNGGTPNTGNKPYHHYNPNAWTGHGSHPPQGVAIVLCEGQKATSLKLNGRAMQHHGPDKNREVWTIRDTSLVGSGGTVEMIDNNGTHKFNVNGGSGMDNGDCA
jgi:hypothetical protein